MKLTFGDRLRESRIKKGLTQEQLAQKIGVAKSTLTGYEKGNREPDVFKIKSLVEMLDVTGDYLLGTNYELPASQISNQNVEKELSQEAQAVATAYDKADTGTQGAIRKLLDIEEISILKERQVG